MFTDFSKINDERIPDAIEQEEILAEAYQQEVDDYPERFVERSECCGAEVYDDAEFCVECYSRSPEIVYVRKEDIARR